MVDALLRLFPFVNTFAKKRVPSNGPSQYVQIRDDSDTSRKFAFESMTEPPPVSIYGALGFGVHQGPGFDGNTFSYALNGVQIPGKPEEVGLATSYASGMSPLILTDDSNVEQELF